MAVYKPKYLVPGSSIEPGLTGDFVAVPDRGYKGKPFVIEYEGRFFKIDNWLKAERFRRFPDKWGRGVYTLGYFRLPK